MESPLPNRAHELRHQWHVALNRHPRLLGSIVAIFALVALGSIAATGWLAWTISAGLPEKNAIRHMGEMDQATAVYDAHDQLAFTIFKEQRIEVPIAEVSPHLVQALLAIEDQHFYEHAGFDVVRIGSAAFANIRRRRAAQGGSTITQQLARQAFLTPNKTMRRKVQELLLAMRIEAMYSKPEILELYLNKVYFGDGRYGAEAAARGYFSKHASELTVAEAALLAGLVKSPSRYAPTVHLDRAKTRRNTVLQAMLDNKTIDRATWEEAHNTPVVLHESLRSELTHGQYFTEEVRQELLERFGWQRVYQGGLRVFTTLDMPMQIAAETAVDEWMKTLDEKRRALTPSKKSPKKGAAPVAAPTAPREQLQAALVSLDPSTGHVRAMVGGRDFQDSHYNRAVQAKRQPGSAFKPFVYAAALEAGYTPATVIDHLNDPIATGQGAWTPEDEHSTAGAMTLRNGLRVSSNRAAVRLLQQIGIPRTVQYARNMGVGDVPSVPSLALGSGEVTLQALTAAYAGFANRGFVPHPVLIRRVEDQEGTVIYETHDAASRAISETTAFLMTTMMADVINAGTASGARKLGFTLPAAGKTGTTNDFNDAWFVGYTPKLVTGVWVGFDHPHTILPRGFAAQVAVPMWAKFMKVATAGDQPLWFNPPSGITTAKICRLSGKLATDACGAVEVVDETGGASVRSMVYTEYFDRGTEPTAYCDLHGAGASDDRIATMMGSGDPSVPQPRDDNGVVRGTAATTGERVVPVGALVKPEPPARQDPGATRATPVTTGDRVAAVGATVKPDPPARQDSGTEPGVAPPAGQVDPETLPNPDKKRTFWQIIGGGREEKPPSDEKPPKKPGV